MWKRLDLGRVGYLGLNRWRHKVGAHFFGALNQSVTLFSLDYQNILRASYETPIKGHCSIEYATVR